MLRRPLSSKADPYKVGSESPLSAVSGNAPSVGDVAESVSGATTPPELPEKERWEQLVSEHSGRVYRLAYRLTGNSHDAEDLTQEVFVRVFRSLHTYTPGTMEGWLHRITTNLFLDQARRKQRIRFDALSDEAATRLPSALPTPDVQHLDRMFDADIEAALSALAPDFRAAVVLCDVEGLTYEEIADVLGLKLGTVRSRIHRGRAQLRAALAHRAPSDGRTRFAGPGLGPTVGLAGQVR